MEGLRFPSWPFSAACPHLLAVGHKGELTLDSLCARFQQRQFPGLSPGSPVLQEAPVPSGFQSPPQRGPRLWSQ